MLRADYNHESNVQILDGAPQFKRETNSLNSAVILQLDNGLELSVWGRNLTNDRYLITLFPTTAQSGSLSGYPSQPRTYGVSGRFKF